MDGSPIIATSFNSTGIYYDGFSICQVDYVAPCLSNLFLGIPISGTPTTSNLYSGQSGLFKDTTQSTGLGIGLWYNDAGTMVNLTAPAAANPFVNQFANNPATTTGLTYGYFGGCVNIGGGTWAANDTFTCVADGTIALTDNDTNLLVVDGNGNVVNIDSSTASNISGNFWRMAAVTTASGAITILTDQRAFATPLNVGFTDFGCSALTLQLSSGMLNTSAGPVLARQQNVTLTDNATNYVEVTAGGTPSANTTAFTAGRYPIDIVTTASGDCTSVVDRRPLMTVVPTAANPSATAGPAANNGSAATFMRSDASPAVQKATGAQFGIVETDNATINQSGSVISTTDGGFPVKYYVGVYCPPGSGTPLDPTGATDMGACFNSAITAAYNGLLSSSHTLASPNASAEIDAPCGSYLLTTPIVPLAAVRFNGGGKGCTVFLVNNSTAGFEQGSGTQLIFADWSNFAIRPTSGNAGATPFVLRSVQVSSFQNISCEGFTTGVCALIAPLTATISPQLYDYCVECGYANSIFNRFDFTTNTAGTVFSVQGHYSSGTTCDVVTTDNDFLSTNEQVQTAAFVDSFCADSNHWHFPLGTFLDNNAILFQFGNDSAHSATDVDVYGQQIDGLVSSYNGTATGMIFLQGGNVSYNHVVHLTSDLEFPACTACFTLTNTQNSATISFAKLDVSGQLAVPANANFYNDFIQGGNHGFFASVLGPNAFGAPSVAAYCYDNTTYNPFAVLVGCTSDARLKDIVGPISLEKAKKALVALDPIQYHWKPTASKDRDLHAHFTAQDVYKVMPECRNTLPGHPADDPYYGIDDGCVLAYAWKIIKDQEHRIGRLEHNNANAHRLSGPHHAGRSGRPGVRLGH